MLSYIYMKILESRPERYDRGINWLSLGQSLVIKNKIVENHVKPGVNALEIGVGTGTLALLMAKKGAHVTGFDVSADMLKVARKKIETAEMEKNIDLVEMGVAGMDRFPTEYFDLVVSTLVFSELSRDEQVYALGHAFRLLKYNGHLIVADEVRPGNAIKRFIYNILRMPLLVITFAVTQTTTRAVEGLEENAFHAGFNIKTIELSMMDSFIYLAAKKERQ